MKVFRDISISTALNLTVVLALTSAWSQAHGAVSFYDNETDFLAAAGATLGFESFESNTVTNSFSSNLVTATDFNVSTSPGSNLGVRNDNFSGVQATDGSNYLGWAAQQNDMDVLFAFNQPITAFSLVATDPLDGGIAGAAFRILVSNNTVADIAVGTIASGTEFFAGVVSDSPFTEVGFLLTATPPTGDGVGFDEVRYNVVPVPAAVWLFSGAVGLLGLLRRKSIR